MEKKKSRRRFNRARMLDQYVDMANLNKRRESFKPRKPKLNKIDFGIFIVRLLNKFLIQFE